MKTYHDPFERQVIRSRALGVLAAAALACVMLTALSLQTAEPPPPAAEPATQRLPGTGANGGEAAPEPPTAAAGA